MLPLTADALDPDALVRCRDEVLAAWGRLDILVNAAGGNQPAATVVGQTSFFDP